MICSVCGQHFKNTKKETHAIICSGCHAFIEEKRKYTTMLKKIFKNDPTLKEPIAV